MSEPFASPPAGHRPHFQTLSPLNFSFIANSPTHSKLLMKISSFWHCLTGSRWALFALTLFISPLLHAADTPAPVKYDEAKAKVEADAAVTAARTTLKKIAAFYGRALLPNRMKSPLAKDWTQAEAEVGEAARLFAEVEADGKTNVDGKDLIYFQQGYIACRLAKYPASIAAYDIAEKAGYAAAQAADDLKGSELWDNRGLAKAALYDYAGAVVDYTAAIALCDRAQWRQHLARAHYNLGEYALAVNDWNSAAKLNPAVGKPPFDPEQTPLNKAIAENPGSAAPLIARARFTFKKAHLEHEFGRSTVLAESAFFAHKETQILKPAFADLDRAVAIEPQSPVVWIERGRFRLVYLSLSSPFAEDAYLAGDSAEKDFLHATELDPKNAEAWFELGRAKLVLWTQGVRTIFGVLKKIDAKQAALRDAAMRDAIAAFSRAIYFQPDASGEAHFQRALALRELTGGTDPTALLVDSAAAIAQNVSATDAGWDGFLTPSPDLARRAAALADMYFTHARISKSLGQMTVALGDYDAALSNYDVALTDFAAVQADIGAERELRDQHLGRSRDAHFERGKLRVQRGDYDGALADFDRVIKDKPELAEAWEWRGLARDGKGETELARADLEEAFKRDPKLRAHVAGSRYDAQSPGATRGLAPKPITVDPKKVPPGTALDRKNAGNALRAKGDVDGALREYTMALLIDPNFADASNNRALVYSERGEIDLALADFNRAIASDPKHRVAYLHRGYLWRGVGEAERERDDLDKAVEFADTDEHRATALLARAVTRQAEGDSEGALTDAIRATELTPKDAATWRLQGYLEMRLTSFAEASVCFRHALEIDPARRDTRVYLAVTLAMQNDAAASTELDTALENSPTDEEFERLKTILAQAIAAWPDSAALKALNEHLINAILAKQTPVFAMADCETWTELLETQILGQSISPVETRRQVSV